MAFLIYLIVIYYYFIFFCNQGTGLNKEAHIKLYEVWPNSNRKEPPKNLQKFKSYLREQISEQGDRNLKVTDWRNGVVSFVVQHFTEYGFMELGDGYLDDDSDDSDDAMVKKHPYGDGGGKIKKK